MDQKSYPNLDPKLKETYDRVMGTTTHKPAEHQVAPTQRVGPPQHVTMVTLDGAEPKDSPAATQVVHSDNLQTPMHHGNTPYLSYNASMAKEEPAHHEESAPKAETKSFPILPVGLALGGVVFFVFYAIFWMKFFGM